MYIKVAGGVDRTHPQVVIGTDRCERRRTRLPPDTRGGLAAADDERRGVFSAALRQAQELADAADAAGYATKPLPLFYCLSQGLRAVAAALETDDSAWRIRGHGASVAPASDVMCTKITPKASRRGGFVDAFSAIQDPVHGISEPVTLAALWRTAPETPKLPAGLAVTAPEPLVLRAPPYKVVRATAVAERRIELAIDGLSVDLTDKDLADALSAYPTLVGGRPIRAVTPDRCMEEGHYLTSREQVTYSDRTSRIGLHMGIDWPLRCPVVSWSLDSETRSHVDFDAAFEYLAPVGVGDRTDRRIVLPALGGSDKPDFLAIWWALLLSLSSLVRYEPALWTDAIDPDRSELAVPFEQVCDYANTFVPQVLRDVLQQER